MNLASYAKGPVKTAAQMVLDYISLKVAVSSTDMRRSVPYRRRVSHDSPDFLGGGQCGEPGSCALDPNAARVVGLAGTTDLLFQNPHGQMWVSMVMMAGLSDYRIPDTILDLIINRDHRNFVQAFHHYSDEIYSGSPSFNINGGGHYSTFAYSVGPFHSSDDAGFSVATVLMPSSMFTSRDDMLRFNGASNDTDRSNMCVTSGFACGLNPVIPNTYMGRDNCTKWADANGNTAGKGATWGFFNEGTNGCARNEYPYYVAFYKNGDYGFLEAFDLRLNPNVSFDAFVAGVLAKNKTSKFSREGTNTYVKYNGDRIDFTISHDSRILRAPFVPNMGIFSSGTLMNTVAGGKHVIKNPATSQQLVLDDSNMYNPIRTETGQAQGPRVIHLPQWRTPLGNPPPQPHNPPPVAPKHVVPPRSLPGH